MIFAHPWALLALIAPLLWVLFEWRRTSRRAALSLKALSFCAAICALAEPVLSVNEDKVAVAVLVDTSESVTAADLNDASQYLNQAESRRGRNWMSVIPFAQSTRPLDASERKGALRLMRTSGDAAQATDLEAAIRDAIAALPVGLVPRILLVSDGNENRGSVARAGWQAQQLGIPIDTRLLAGRERPGLRLDSVVFPSLAFTGEKFPIDLVVESPRRTTGTVEIAAEGKTLGTSLLGSSKVQIEAGTTQLRVHASLNAPGAIQISGKISTQGLGEAHFDQAVTLRRPRMLYVSQDPAGSETNLLGAIGSSQFEVDRAQVFPAGPLGDYQVITLNNWDLESIALPRKADLEAYVRQGGGLLIIGGERNVYVENKPAEDALDRVLPAKLAPPRSPEGTCVVLIIDKSSSMEGRKMELARLAAIGVIENLRPVDSVGVLIFDNSFQWAVPIRRAEDRTMIKRLVAGITPDGGTQIAPALGEAYKRINPQKATYKHIVLLTDGISEEGDSASLAREAAAQNVTISTVGLGQDVNRAYLEKIAVFAKGKSYFLNDPAGLEQILLKDVMEHTGTTAVEKPIVPVITRNSDILTGVGMERAPALGGYVKFISKPTADTILTVDKDPLLAVWQFGLGRSAVFTSDAKSRWAEQWISWPGFDRFWTNLFRDLLPHAQTGEATAQYDIASGKLVVDYRLTHQAESPAKVPDIFVIGPAGFERPIAVRKVAEGAYRGEVAIGKRQGLFRIRPLVDSKAFPEIGFYRQQEEAADYGSNKQLLSQVSAFTGGRFNPDAAELFESGGRWVPSTLRLWPGLLALAMALNLAELVMRKWKAIPGLFKRG